VSYLNIAVLVGTLSLALFNSAKDDITRYFSYAYAVISIGIIVRVSYSHLSWKALTLYSRYMATSCISTESPSSVAEIPITSVRALSCTLSHQS
jgi:hypothetical protein